LLGKRLDDEITVDLPSGAATVLIVEIRYGDRPYEHDPQGPGP